MDPTPADDAPPSRPDRRPGRAFVVLPAATFLVGLLLGAGLVRLAFEGDNDDGDGGAGQASPSPSAAATPSASPDAIVVPGACTRAAREAGSTVALLRDALGAITDLDAARLADILDELEKLDQQIREDVATCRLQASESP